MKILVIISLMFLLASCDMEPQNSHSEVRHSDRWIVEKKEYGLYMTADKRYFCLSNTDEPTELRRIEVGQHTFNTIEVGDTFICRI